MKPTQVAEDAMRSGTLWQSAVLASLALLTSGQLCMLTTCVPRLHNADASAQHACCRATPERSAPAKSQHAPGTMPCDVMLHAATAPILDSASPLTMPAALLAAAASTLAPPAHVTAPFAETDTGPPLARLSPAPAGVRAPPQA
jgi:hypothetical protein